MSELQQPIKFELFVVLDGKKALNIKTIDIIDNYTDGFIFNANLTLDDNLVILNGMFKVNIHVKEKK